MALVRMAPADLADRLGLSLASELVSNRVPLTREAAVRAPVYPVTADVAMLLPQAGLSGQIAIPAERRGATSMLWRLLAGPSSTGLWCAVVGLERLYPLAATAAGVDLSRVAFVDAGPEEIGTALGVLSEGVPVIVVPTKGLSPVQRRRAAARARRSGSAVIWWEGSSLPVPGVDARLVPTRCEWRGLRANDGRRWGAGRLDSCRIAVAATWRGRDTPVRSELWPYGRD